MVRLVNNIKEANCVTHSGTMHADEVFATAFLDLYYGSIRVFRTSSVDMNEIDSHTIVYDVGRGKFDHHQADALVRESGIPYSSVGLLWKEFGRDFLIQEGYLQIDALWNGIDKDLIEGIDADDNGVFPKIESNCKVKTLSNIIKIFNPSYSSSEKEGEQFLKAVDVAKQIFKEEILYVNGKVVADQKLKKIIDDKKEDEKYLLLDEYLPYEESILNHSKGDSILLVGFPSNRGGYAIKTVPKSVEDKTARLEFPEEWAGLTDSDLEKVSGIKGLRFCHTGRFIVSCNDIESVYQVFNKLCK